MAEERNVGVARAAEPDEDQTKAELQRRMEEARESITQTVTEIKDTVTHQYQHVKETVTEALDWREQYRKRPVVWTVGALGAGFVVGYAIGGVFGGGRNDDDDYPSYAASDVFARTGASPAPYPATQSADPVSSPFTDHHAYAAHAIPNSPQRTESEPADRPSYSSGYEPDQEEDSGPGLIERFKETRAYDRLQEEVAGLGNRMLDELSQTARSVVLPAIFNKIKEMVGVNLSGQKESGGGGSSRRPQTYPPVQKRPAAQQPATAQAGGTSGRVAENRPSPGGESGAQSSGYDDRYEREAQMFGKGEGRGFSTPGGKGADAQPGNGEGNPRGEN